MWGQTAVTTPLQVGFALIDYHVDEGGLATIQVTLNMTSTETVTVTYTTEQADSLNRALIDRDFTPASGELTFAPGVTEQTFTVPTLQDIKYEGEEVLRLRLSDPQNAELGYAYRARLYIASDDLFNPLLLDDFEIFPYPFKIQGGLILEHAGDRRGGCHGAARAGRHTSTSWRWRMVPGRSCWRRRCRASAAPSPWRRIGAQHEQLCLLVLRHEQRADRSPSSCRRTASPILARRAGPWCGAMSSTAWLAAHPRRANGRTRSATASTRPTTAGATASWSTTPPAPENSATDGTGSLVITAQEIDPATTELECWYGPCEYTSARLVSAQKFEMAYGRVEARMKLPYGQGLWPAFWMLGSDIGEAGWPTCGEIDIMEHIGSIPDTVYGTIHGPGYSGGAGIGGSYTLD